MNVAEAVEATEIVRPSVTISMHYLHAKPEAFEKLMCGKSEVKILEIGEVLIL